MAQHLGARVFPRLASSHEEAPRRRARIRGDRRAGLLGTPLLHSLALEIPDLAPLDLGPEIQPVLGVALPRVGSGPDDATSDLGTLFGNRISG
jgi:hypothetical protein